MRLPTSIGAAALALLVLASTARADDTAKAHFDQAEMYMQAQVFDKAIQEYEASYKLAPTAHLLLFNIGLAYDKWAKRKPALDHFQRYLAQDPNGPKAAEATARVARLEREIAAFDTAIADASAFENKGEHDRAAAAYLLAYGMEPEMHIYLFQAGAAQQAGDNKADAIATFERYITADPRGERVDEARKRKTALEAELRREQAERARLAEQAQVTHTPGQPVDTEGKSRVNWWQVGLGAVAVGLGVVLDWGPPPARNEKLDGTDFIPIGLYGIGGTLVFTGVF